MTNNKQGANHLHLCHVLLIQALSRRRARSECLTWYASVVVIGIHYQGAINGGYQLTSFDILYLLNTVQSKPTTLPLLAIVALFLNLFNWLARWEVVQFVTLFMCTTFLFNFRAFRLSIDGCPTCSIDDLKFNSLIFQFLKWSCQLSSWNQCSTVVCLLVFPLKQYVSTDINAK